MKTGLARRQASGGAAGISAVEQLDMLRAFTYADGLDLDPQATMHPRLHRGRERCSAVTLALLELCWVEPFATQVLMSWLCF
jgi:hypothetical protein